MPTLATPPAAGGDDQLVVHHPQLLAHLLSGPTWLLGAEVPDVRDHRGERAVQPVRGCGIEDILTPVNEDFVVVGADRFIRRLIAPQLTGHLRSVEDVP